MGLTTPSVNRTRFRAIAVWVFAFCFLFLGFASAGEPDWRTLVNNGQLVEISKIDPTIRVEMRYATTHNCTGEILYPPNLPCLIRPEIALRLKAAQQYLRSWGYGLKIWDAYRPPEAQQALWKRWARRGYVADPGDGRGSLHTWGLAVDVTLVDKSGQDVAMPSDFDVFTEEASGIYRGKDGKVGANLHLLHRAMFGSGFQGLSTEWWHFAARGWEKFDRLTAEPDRKLPPAVPVPPAATPAPPTRTAPSPAPPAN